MKKMVTIARALKEKNRVAGKLAKVRELVKAENSHEVKVPRSVEVKDLYAESWRLMSRLIDIKSAVAVANAGIVAKIIALDEVKAAICYLNGLDTKEGVFEESNYNGKVVREYQAELRQAEVLKEIDRLQKQAEDIQDSLDEYNAVTKVEVEFDE